MEIERVCRNCKYFYNNKCLNRHIGIEFDTRRGHEFIEDGTMSLALEEELNIKELAKIILDEMYKKGTIKIKPDFYIKKFDMDDIQSEIITYIEDALYRPLENYFDGRNYGEGMIIKNPSEFSCSEWD